MKYFYIIICILLLIALSGCVEQEPIESVVDPNTTEENVPLIPEIGYSEISAIALDSTTYKKPIGDAGFDSQNLFLEDEKVCGYDYVAFFDIKGSVTVYLADGKPSSIVFGSNPFDDVTKLSGAISDVSNGIASAFGVEAVSPSLVGADDSDGDDVLMNGKGCYVVKYETDEMNVSVKSCGVNGLATVVVEVSPKK